MEAAANRYQHMWQTCLLAALQQQNQEQHNKQMLLQQQQSNIPIQQSQPSQPPQTSPISNGAAGKSAQRSGGSGSGGSGSSGSRQKPPYSYISMIALAIQSAPGQKATLSDINKFLVNNFPFFQGPYQGWKNSVRHNLSLNECFVKVLRNPLRPWAKDNYWAIKTGYEVSLSRTPNRKRKRLSVEMEAVAHDMSPNSTIGSDSGISMVSISPPMADDDCVVMPVLSPIKPLNTNQSTSISLRNRQFMIDSLIHGKQP